MTEVVENTETLSFGEPDPRILARFAVDSVVEVERIIPKINGLPATEYPTRNQAIQWKDWEDDSIYIAGQRRAKGRDYSCACCGGEIPEGSMHVVRIRLHPEKVFPYDHLLLGHFDVTREAGDIDSAQARHSSRTRSRDIELLRRTIQKRAKDSKPASRR